MRRTVTTCLMALGFLVSQAQAPGGVSSGLTTWLRADAGTSSTTDGDFLSFWNDQSSGGNNATQALGTAQPKYKKFALNGKPAIETNGGSRFFNVDMTDISNSEYTIFTVVKRQAASANQFFLGVQQTAPNGLHIGYANNVTLRFSQNGQTANATVSGYNAATESPTIVIARYSNVTGREIVEIKNSNLSSASSASTSAFTITNQGVIGRGFSTSGFTGFISEVIIYNRNLSAAERRLVQNYLAIKYGITIPIASNDYFNDASFYNDIFGIGRDLTGQGLDVENGSSENPDDIVEIYSPSSLNDGDFLLVGNNDGAKTFSAFVGSNCAITNILGRVWKAEETGDVGTISMKFDMTGISMNPESLILLVDTDGDGFNDETPIEGTYSAPFITFSNVTLNDGHRFTLAEGVAHWYARASGNATDAIWAKTPTGPMQAVGSWCSRVDVTIMPGVTITAAGSITARLFEVKTGGVFNQGNSNLTVHGNFQIDGTYSVGTGSVYLNGTAAQSISGATVTDLQNLYLNNSAGASISGAGLRMKRLLQVNSGTFNTNGKLTLISDGTNQGSIGPLTGGDLIGNVTIQRYHNATAAGWVNLCAPVSGKTVNDWNDDLITTGFTGSDYPSYPFNNIQWYNESAPGNKNQGYVGVTNITDALVTGRGYFVYMNAGAMNLDVDGQIYKGNQSLPVTYTNNGVPTADGYSLIANPYPSAINWDAAGWTKTNLDNAVYVWNAANAQYSSYIGGVSTNGGSPIIPSTQSFFVMANGASPALTATETVKNTAQGTFKSLNEELPALNFSLTGNGRSDEMTILVHESASIGFDSHADAHKMRSPVEDVPTLTSLSSEGAELSINSIPAFRDELSIPLILEAGTPGSYTLSWNGVARISEFYNEVLLEDLTTGALYNMSAIEYVKLTLNNTDQQEANYVLHLRQKQSAVYTGGLPVSGSFISGELRLNFFFPEEEEVLIRAWNMLGQELITPIQDRILDQTISIPNVPSNGTCLIEVIVSRTGERAVLRIAAGQQP